MESDNERLSEAVTFRITRDEERAVTKLSEREDRKFSDMLRRIFRKGLKAMDAPKRIGR